MSISRSQLDAKFDEDPLVRYKWFKTPASPYTNNGEYFAVVTGLAFQLAPGTQAANTTQYTVTVKDPAGDVIDEVAVIAENYVAVPVTGGTIFQVVLPRRLLVPPGGTVNGYNGKLSVVLCRTLTDAMLAL